MPVVPRGKGLHSQTKNENKGLARIQTSVCDIKFTRKGGEILAVRDIRPHTMTGYSTPLVSGGKEGT